MAVLVLVLLDIADDTSGIDDALELGLGLGLGLGLLREREEEMEGADFPAVGDGQSPPPPCCC